MILREIDLSVNSRLSGMATSRHILIPTPQEIVHASCSQLKDQYYVSELTCVSTCTPGSLGGQQPTGKILAWSVQVWPGYKETECWPHPGKPWAALTQAALTTSQAVRKLL